MARKSRNARDPYGVIHALDSYAKEYAWTLCGMIFEHHKALTKRAPTCLACVVKAK